MMKLTILGCHSATPRENKHTTSQLLEVKGHLFLIDCGEGTQIQLRKGVLLLPIIETLYVYFLLVLQNDILKLLIASYYKLKSRCICSKAIKSKASFLVGTTTHSEG